MTSNNGVSVNTTMSGVVGANTITVVSSSSLVVGMAVVLPFTVFIALVSSCLAVAQGDFGQAIVHIVNALPIVGQTVVKAMSKVEDINRRFQKKKDKLLQIPIVANIVNATIPNIGGKRFSTYRNNNKKWKKTRRNRSKTL